MRTGTVLLVNNHCKYEFESDRGAGRYDLGSYVVPLCSCIELLSQVATALLIRTLYLQENVAIKTW